MKSLCPTQVDLYNCTLVLATKPVPQFLEIKSIQYALFVKSLEPLGFSFVMRHSR